MPEEELYSCGARATNGVSSMESGASGREPVPPDRWIRGDYVCVLTRTELVVRRSDEQVWFQKPVAELVGAKARTLGLFKHRPVLEIDYYRPGELDTGHFALELSTDQECEELAAKLESAIVLDSAYHQLERGVCLRKVDTSSSHSSVYVYIDRGGNLVLDGQDVGPSVEAIHGDSDYEYWVKVDKAQKDRLLLLLMEHVFSGDSRASSRFMEWLKERDVPFKFESY